MGAFYPARPSPRSSIPPRLPPSLNASLPSIPSKVKRLSWAMGGGCSQGLSGEGGTLAGVVGREEGCSEEFSWREGMPKGMSAWDAGGGWGCARGNRITRGRGGRLPGMRKDRGTLRARCEHVPGALRVCCERIASEARAKHKRSASALRAHCQHITSTLRAHCEHTASTLHAHCDHIASTS